MSNREIGSEFWNVPISEAQNSLFPDNTVWFLSGRCALRAIIHDIQRKIHFQSVALPSWCCDSIVAPFLQAGVTVKFYSVYVASGQLKQDFAEAVGCDAVLVMDFFGYRRLESFSYDGLVIYDATHSVFSPSVIDADYTFGSLRKWAGFSSGGFAYAKSGMLETVVSEMGADYIAMRRMAMEKKRTYISGCTGSKEFLQMFGKAEEILDVSSREAGAEEDVYVAKHLDVEQIVSRRRENAAILLDAVSDFAVFPELLTNDCPLFVPLLIPDGKRDALKRHLISRGIYCPVHWPLTSFHTLQEPQTTIYSEEISLVCDQRYDERDMERICKEINVFLNRGN